MIKQAFTIEQCGWIKSGAAAFEADPKTGQISATGVVRAGLALITKSYEDHEQITVDPGLLLSANVRQGQSLKFGALTLKVQSMEKQIASVMVGVVAERANLKGAAVLNLKGQYIQIDKLALSGEVAGFDVTIKLTPVQK